MNYKINPMTISRGNGLSAGQAQRIEDGGAATGPEAADLAEDRVAACIAESMPRGSVDFEVYDCSFKNCSPVMSFVEPAWPAPPAEPEKIPIAAATALAADLAEDYVAACLADSMIRGSREKAKEIRALATAESGRQAEPPISTQRYLTAEHTILTAIYALDRGTFGFKLVATK